MKTISAKDYNEIRKWIYRNGRQLEIARWNYLFEHGSKEDVVKALSFYQNEDGGFGNALEPDNWNPNSSPYTTLYAIQVLKEVDGIDLDHPIVQGIIKYLESSINSDELGWYFSIPSNDHYPHAPWWTYDKEANKVESIGVTAGIVNFVLSYLAPQTTLYQRAYELLDTLLDKLVTEDNFGNMGATEYSRLLKLIHTLNLEKKYDIKNINEKIKDIVNSYIERDVSKWSFYGHTPREYISSPESEFYEGNEEITQKELDYLIDTRKENGVWEITWSWFDNNEKYAKEFAISENWWRAEKAIEKLVFLKNFNRIEE